MWIRSVDSSSSVFEAALKHSESTCNYARLLAKGEETLNCKWNLIHCNAFTFDASSFHAL